MAIQFPIQNGTALYTGRLGDTITTEQGYDAARLCALNILSQIKKHVGLERITAINHLDIYFQQADNRDNGPKVADGASKTFLELLGDLGQHSRAIMGVQNLPPQLLHWNCIELYHQMTFAKAR